MPLYLVRHAKAGSRSGWLGPDEARPLSKSGREQAQGIKRLLAEWPASRILSSPFVRCMETVTPLATKLGLEVEPTPMLAEGHAVAEVLELLVALPDHAVLCSHGDLIPAVIEALARRGMVVDGEPDWRKGATWVIERDGDEFVRASALPPPS
jgi:phosphohistidine phosphatase SixA